MLVGKIYVIKNDINDKVYVGQTIQTLKKRFNGHCCYSKSDRSDRMYIKRAIHKYGKEHFSIELIEECPTELLNERESFWINKFDSYNNGYNLTLGGSESNSFSLHRLENTIDIKKFRDYIIEFHPSANEVSSHFGICKCSVYNLIKRLGDDNLKLRSFTPRKTRGIEDINSDELISLYEDGWSILDLVKKYHVRKNIISNYIKSKGIKVHRGIKGYKHRI